MHNINIPSDRELPSTSTLIKSTILAAMVACLLLVTVVMPAEYGIDPTGLGDIVGLKRMGEIRTSLAEEAAADVAAQNIGATKTVAEVDTVIVEAVVKVEPVKPAVAPSNAAHQNHEISFSLAPDEGTEVKVTMIKGAKVNYIWETNGGKLNFDVHGDSKKLNINYHSYYKGSDSTREGRLEAAFDGGHGWFWRNRTENTQTITIKTTGEYTAIKRY
ncbi:MAG: hypothetical protein ACI8VC_000748 [Candidatus Endobugula sp.]|jgi:hypothetical protein